MLRHFVPVLLLIAFGNGGKAPIYIHKSSNPEGSCVTYQCTDYFDGRPYQELFTIGWKDSQRKNKETEWYFKTTSHEYVLGQVNKNGNSIGKIMALEFQKNIIKITITENDKIELTACGFTQRQLTNEAKEELIKVCNGEEMKTVNQTNCD